MIHTWKELTSDVALEHSIMPVLADQHKQLGAAEGCILDIRRLQRGDGPVGLEGLVLLSRAFFEEYQSYHEELFRIETLADEEIIGYFSRFLQEDGHAAFIALRDDEVVGYITICVQPQPVFWKIKRVGHISGLMVRKRDRRQGIGTRLLDEARAYFRDQGVKYYTVYTAVQNRAAIEFYKRQGLETLHSNLVGAV